jgi:hypothetical protein
MKKFLGVLVIAASLVACNNSADTVDNTKDSLDSVEKAKKEGVENAADSTINKIDSTYDAAKDSLQAKDSLSK